MANKIVNNSCTYETRFDMMLATMFERCAQSTFEALKTLTALIDCDLFSKLIVGLSKVSSLASRVGPYEVLEHNVRLELMDARGNKAIYYKDQKVRFLQNNVIAYQDKAWGAGKIFADYKCSPGVCVDRYREGYRYRVLISLRGTKNYGDIEEFHIRRTILNGFNLPQEDLQTDIDHRTHKVSVSVIFPKVRPPRKAHLVEKNSTHITSLDNQHIQMLPDGRTKLFWATSHPRLYEAYILAWHW